MLTEGSSKLFEIRPVESKGLGAITSASIPRGTLILCEPPLFTLSINALPATESSIQEILSTKSTTEYAQYNNLFNATATLKPNEPLSGIFRTNSLPCGGNDTNLETQPAYEYGIFPVGSRFNSSCRPNVSAYWNPDSNEMEFRVMKDVETGEELCISYCDILKSREERRKALKQTWNFDCHCDGCECKPFRTVGASGEVMDEEEAVMMSDMRRVSVGGLLETVAFGYTVDATILALRLLEDEGILHFQETLAHDAFELTTKDNNKPSLESVTWARKAWKASCIVTGPDSPNSQRLLNVYEAAKIQNQEDPQSDDSDTLEESNDDDTDNDESGYYSE